MGLSMNDHKTTSLNAAVIILYGYTLPVAVVFGALIGASFFILNSRAYSNITKAYFFLVSFLFGVFGYDNAAALVSVFMPKIIDMQVNDFIGAVICSSFAIKALEKIYWCIENRTLSFWKTGGHP
jgi:hypothetical protein